MQERKKKEIASSAPYSPAEYTTAMAVAARAILDGTASPEQQRDFMLWLVKDVCKTYDQSYRPDSSRDTDFAEGKRFVGLTLVKMIHLNTRAIVERKTGEPQEPDNIEPRLI